MGYGAGRSRFHENKRAVEEKYMGPLIKTVMTRCIHCTRCVRFMEEVAGVEEIGAINRGEHTEITTYLEHAVTSELSGNVIDLCPVGALTSKPYAFAARSWELRKTESIDVHDAVGSAIRIDTRGREVMRILPRLNEDVNEEWLADKSRFAYDGLKRQRLDTPYVRRDGKLQPATWQEAFQAVADRINGRDGGKLGAIAGDLACAESMTALKDLMVALGSANMDCRQDGARIDPARRAGYLFNTTFAGIEQADACLLIGTNPRLEAPLVNARLRKRWLAGGFPIASVGPQADLTYRVEPLGAGPQTLGEIAGGTHPFAQVLKSAETPMLIVGQGALARPDGSAVLAAARRIADDTGMVAGGWNGFNVLHTAAARVGGLELGFVPGEGGLDTNGILDAAAQGNVDTVLLLGADEIDMDRLGSAFTIYIGSHGDAGAHRADVILPGAAYSEKNATWVNTEGRAQRGYAAVFPPGDAREDWTILRALSDVLGKRLPYDDIAALRGRMEDAAPCFAELDEVIVAAWEPFGASGDMDPAPFVSPISDYYLTNPISRASATMAMCSAELTAGGREATGTDG
jgi:NADH-quinone oxidoreductase subunit G